MRYIYINAAWWAIIIILSINQSVIQHTYILLLSSTPSPSHSRTTYSSSPYNGRCTSSRRLLQAPRHSTLTPPCRPTGTTFCPPTRLARSPVQTYACARCRALDFRYTTTRNLLAGRAVAVYLSLFNFTHDALLTSLCRCNRSVPESISGYPQRLVRSTLDLIIPWFREHLPASDFKDY